MAKKPPSKAKNEAKGLKPATLLVHGGILRSQFGENAEAIFMTQSYVYDREEI
jgi:O-succinylhomoserine sulfhydrylase